MEIGTLRPLHSVRSQAEDSPFLPHKNAPPTQLYTPLSAHIPTLAHASSEPLLCPAKPGLRRTRPVCRMEGQEACTLMFVPEAGREGGRGEGLALCSLWLRKQKLEGPQPDLFTHQEIGKLQGSDSPNASPPTGGWRQRQSPPSPPPVGASDCHPASR